ncbi:MAG: Peptidase M20D, amidohydrolase [uncultured Thermomicrobiales bacterium]|uniref:Peptidase M20D, amidohydrolase n=1 Tax=uncultured Thermomicrobiales bacterium TaxID=1645740 RepID=A0A6J4V4L9_9BACT|nr:MAG: Peptidase M20D, amidohydrolase [uncultured Thermomicrobiales bacterium]
MVAASQTLHDAIDEILPGLVADRRHLHEHPELGMQEYETARFVAGRLQQLGLEDIRTGIANTGVTALIRGTGTGPNADRTLMLRADMDALPITEENEVEYRSQTPGVMHACGHDAHTSMLLATARLLMERRAEFAGTVKVLFQPAEEAQPGGAKPMIEAGVLEDPRVDASFGLHMAQDLELGRITARPGASSANSDRFYITVQGKGGHGAAPHTTIDPIVVASQIVLAIQTLVSRETDPLGSAVVTVGAFNAGSAPNVIPDTAELVGSMRTFDTDFRDHLAERLDTLVTKIATAMGATGTLRFVRGYPSVVNDEGMFEIVRAAASEVVGPDNFVIKPASMGGEDMSYFLQQVPGCFFHVGSKNAGRGLVWGHHHPKFDIDEASLGIGVEVMVTSVLRYFATENPPVRA